MQHDYYRQPLDSHNCCPPPHPHPHPHPHPGNCPHPVKPTQPWEMDIAEHNTDKSAHPYLLGLIKGKSMYLSRDTIALRDAIEEDLRSVGLMVYVTQTDELYRLEGDITNDNWKTLNVNSKQYIKLGRLNAPMNPSDGMVYFNLIQERLYVYLKDKWVGLPNQKDIKNAVLEHNADPHAHAERFAEVENIWFTI